MLENGKQPCQGSLRLLNLNESSLLTECEVDIVSEEYRHIILLLWRTYFLVLFFQHDRHWIAYRLLSNRINKNENRKESC